MIPIFRIIKDVLTPGSPEFKAQLSLVNDEQARLVKALHLLDQPAIRDIKAATDSAAEFR